MISYLIGVYLFFNEKKNQLENQNVNSEKGFLVKFNFKNLSFSTLNLDFLW